MLRISERRGAGHDLPEQLLMAEVDAVERPDRGDDLRADLTLTSLIPSFHERAVGGASGRPGPSSSAAKVPSMA